MKKTIYLLLFVSGVAACLFPCNPLLAQQAKKENNVFPKFKAHLIDRLPRGYKVGVVDIDGDGKLDIIGLATEPSCLVWYKNPGWDRFVLTSKTKEYVDLAPFDIDGDGRTDLAIADEFGMNRTTSGGLIHWLKCPQDPSQEWPMFVIGAEPTSHRLKWADIDGDGRKELVNAPIMGRNAKEPLWDVGVNLIWYKTPKPPSFEPWEPQIIDNNLTVVHGMCVVNWDNDPAPIVRSRAVVSANDELKSPTRSIGAGDDILVASFEGIHLFQPQKEANKLSWKKTKLGSGDQTNPNKRGSSEIDVGTVGPGKSRYLAAIEPWHGNNVVVYTPPSSQEKLWQRSVIDTTFNEGHALVCGDLDGDGDDEIIAGYRGKGYGLYIYNCQDSIGQKWERITLDEGDMAASGLQVADINNDGRLDVVCVGTATSNIKWYENLGLTP
jgi:hypothetical protein